MQTNFYLPILKSKLGEFTALGHLKAEWENSITPLFEITPLEWDQTERTVPRTLNEHLDSFCKKLLRKWPTSNCFIDPALLKWNGIDNRDKISYVFGKLAEKNVVPAPVMSLNYSAEFLSAFTQIIRTYSIHDIGIRVNPNDITEPDFEGKIDTLLNELALEPNRCHMIIDLVNANFAEIDNFADAIVGILESFPFSERWRSITVAGTAFPSSGIIKEGTSYFPRNDWKFYLTLTEKLKDSSFKRHINYGDYSIVNPDYFEFNPKIMKASANIRYTLDSQWMIIKGKALKESKDYEQYKKLVKAVVETKDADGNEMYMGEEFSKGDLHLAKCMRGDEGPGAPSVWNWVGNNHHFEKVLTDIAAMNHAV